MTDDCLLQPRAEPAFLRLLLPSPPPPGFLATATRPARPTLRRSPATNSPRTSPHARASLDPALPQYSEPQLDGASRHVHPKRTRPVHKLVKGQEDTKYSKANPPEETSDYSERRKGRGQEEGGGCRNVNNKNRGVRTPQTEAPTTAESKTFDHKSPCNTGERERRGNRRSARGLGPARYRTPSPARGPAGVSGEGYVRGRRCWRGGWTPRRR